jgi:hypothetical protein
MTKVKSNPNLDNSEKMLTSAYPRKGRRMKIAEKDISQIIFESDTF